MRDFIGVTGPQGTTIVNPAYIISIEEHHHRGRLAGQYYGDCFGVKEKDCKVKSVVCLHLGGGTTTVPSFSTHTAIVNWVNR